jgi:hypothetical protein
MGNDDWHPSEPQLAAFDSGALAAPDWDRSRRTSRAALSVAADSTVFPTTR